MISNSNDKYLTTRELAELLRIKERKVYDMASQGAARSWADTSAWQGVIG